MGENVKKSGNIFIYVGLQTFAELLIIFVALVLSIIYENKHVIEGNDWYLAIIILVLAILCRIGADRFKK